MRGKLGKLMDQSISNSAILFLKKKLGKIGNKASG
jgi:hypothetical protein